MSDYAIELNLKSYKELPTYIKFNINLWIININTRLIFSKSNPA